MGLEEDKIAGFSNSRKNQSEMSFGLEEDEITGYSNGQCCFVLFCVGLEEDKITWFSNEQDLVRKRNKALEEE